MPVSPFIAAALQFRVDVGDVPANRERAFRLVEKAAALGARLCVLPEMWSTGFAEEDLLRLSRTTPEVLHDVRRLAGRLKVVIAGSLPERVGRGIYNTLYVVNATGVVTGEYRKTHLFSPSGEDRWFRRGFSTGVVPTDAGVVGPLICYDLRFPELARKYFLDGAGVLCVSSQWPSVRRAHWRILTVARAVENQAYVVAANAVGPSGPFRYAGDSVIVSTCGARAVSSARGGAGGRSPGGIERRRFRPAPEGEGATGAEGGGPGVPARLAFLRLLRDDLFRGHPGAVDPGGGPPRPGQGGRLEGEGDRGVGHRPRARRRREDDPVPRRTLDDRDPRAGRRRQAPAARIVRRADRNVAISVLVVNGPGLTRTVPAGKVPRARWLFGEQ